ncbi:Hypothetical protein R9X50_00397000 [Acrodontium crateriforme]|uniref:Uncharacterized protein n=1 Tax=Acrodontium crateriforme TaxID=150365 RepID=A0AAQ3M4H1_9PEZI|nr:Hypothetical protein R9X50_00397000 [Acrodontium crateriforme]
MKINYAAAVAFVTTQTFAHSFSTSGSVSSMTTTYDDCPSASIETITTTNTVTVTHCPECEMDTSVTSTAGHTTVYTTTSLSLGLTSSAPANHTSTESCTSTLSPCHTIPDVTSSSSQTTGAVSSTVTTSAPTTLVCNGADCGSNNNTSSGSSSPPSLINSPPSIAVPYPTSATTCSGPGCGAATSSLPSAVVSGNTSHTPPFTAGASDVSRMGFTTSLMMVVVVAGFTFAI